MKINQALEIYLGCNKLHPKDCDKCSLRAVVYPDKNGDTDFDLNICGCFADIETTLLDVKDGENGN